MTIPTTRRSSFLLVPACLAGALIVLALPALAGEVYQWKDAKGVTHYSDAPPVAEKPVAANTDCSKARSNLTILQGTTAVGIDLDNDGKADRNLTTQERANRVVLAEASIKTYCEVALANEP
jgi:hypothetical protein